MFMFVDFVFCLQTSMSAVEAPTTVITTLVAPTRMDHSGVLVIVVILVKERFVMVS
jgi:hypothetical protein